MNYVTVWANGGFRSVPANGASQYDHSHWTWPRPERRVETVEYDEDGKIVKRTVTTEPVAAPWRVTY